MNLEISNKIKRTIDDIRLETISRSGLIPFRSRVKCSSAFEAVWEVASYSVASDIINILQCNYKDLDKALQEFKDNFISRFMTLHHKYIVTSSKFNWNWD